MNLYSKMKIYRFVSSTMCSNMYVIESNGHALMIDPCEKNTSTNILNKLIVDGIILTHEHYDHICEVNYFKEYYGCKVACGEKAAEGLNNPTLNMSKHIEQIANFKPFGITFSPLENCDFKCDADINLSDNTLLKWQNEKIYIKETPGHSKGSISILINNLFLFSGDLLFKDFSTQVKFPGGNKKDWENISKPWIESLDYQTIVYPGHFDSFNLREKINK